MTFYHVTAEARCWTLKNAILCNRMMTTFLTDAPNAIDGYSDDTEKKETIVWVGQ